MKKKIAMAVLVSSLALTACGPGERAAQPGNGKPDSTEKAAEPETQMPAETKAETEAAPREQQVFTISEKGKTFLADLGRRTPDFVNSPELSEDFWTDFIFLYYTGATEEEINGTKEPVEPIIISRGEVDALIRLIFGTEFSIPEPAQEDMEEGRTTFYYEDGSYYIGRSDYPDYQYTYTDSTAGEDGTITANFRIAFEGDENVGTLVYTLAAAENENGFIVLQKKTVFSEE